MVSCDLLKRILLDLVKISECYLPLLNTKYLTYEKPEVIIDFHQ